MGRFGPEVESSLNDLHSLVKSVIPTSFNVKVFPLRCKTFSSGHDFTFFLINRKRCFWFIEDEAWICVST